MSPSLFEVHGLSIAGFSDRAGVQSAFDARAATGTGSGIFDSDGSELPAGWVRLVDDVDFAVDQGEVLALVGESGSGKTMTLLGALGLLGPRARVVEGETVFMGQTLQALAFQTRRGRIRRKTRLMPELDSPEWRRLVGQKIGILFQDPIAAWSPDTLIGDQTGEVLAEHTSLSHEQITSRVLDALGEVRLSRERKFLSFRHELSRGEAQRAMLAAALIKAPALLIADEPLSGLDPPVAAAILDLIAEMQATRGMAMVMVTHDLATVARIATKVAVMYAGRIVELGSVEDVFYRPKHPYTEGLLGSIPWPGGGRLRPIQGEPPKLGLLPAGCAFAPRCPYAEPDCLLQPPELEGLDGTDVACFRAPGLSLRGVRS